MRVWFDNENNRLNVIEIPQISFATVCDVLVDQQLSVTVAKPGSQLCSTFNYRINWPGTVIINNNGACYSFRPCKQRQHMQKENLQETWNQPKGRRHR